MDRLTLLKSIPIFSKLDQESLKKIDSISIEKHYRKGDIIILQDSAVEGLYVIRDGRIRISRISEDGKIKTLAILSSGEIMGEMSILTEESASATAEALEDSRLIFIKREDFQSILLRYPMITLAIAQVLAKRLRIADREIEELAFYSVKSRVIKMLIELANRYGERAYSGIKISLKLTHQELADIVGTSRETVSRVISALEKKELIVNEGGYTVIRDIEALKDYIF